MYNGTTAVSIHTVEAMGQDGGNYIGIEAKSDQNSGYTCLVAMELLFDLLHISGNLGLGLQVVLRRQQPSEHLLQCRLVALEIHLGLKLCNGAGGLGSGATAFFLLWSHGLGGCDWRGEIFINPSYIHIGSVLPEERLQKLNSTTITSTFDITNITIKKKLVILVIWTSRLGSKGTRDLSKGINSLLYSQHILIVQTDL